ncbi:hypothetical protein BFW01_g5309 [Lasiodiplodia theobromae]|uniref:Inheritance of peroxisomes protein 1 n=1 Tax=Lasiodiplodia theobromae TaxID=45133 RepID=A0A5N5D4U9_9PEZI|nr:uncharacterized protein LTHEOB_12661 [Lasiodiplodia theobromae]KAB2572452.1 hypothetical protein DBV05_g8909 [Lasiodiplodia theobromae]KAF4535715.1 hypothetical protein LTHEOB_12661 [Lasiodiplodia theobromae]KAF9634414.1 hypothetical protein BFW01_g5309 [Lasiodiplodia theobromae]
MSSPPAPSTTTPAQPTAKHGVRRSFTLPTRLAGSSPAAQSPGSADGVEILFNHSFAKILLFTTASSLSRPSSSASNRTVLGDNGHADTIPWISPTESTVAAGPIRIYRVPGSVAFLHSGSLLHAILPKSQCWCVDGVSKFAMRIPRPNSYYRIELPGEGAENLAKVEEFKAVMEKVLLYEKTVCPFTRGFHVEIPEVPATPPRKKRPVTPGRAKKWKLDGIWKPEDGQRPVSQGTERSFTSETSTISASSGPYRRSSVFSTSSISSSIVEDETPSEDGSSESSAQRRPPLKANTRPAEGSRSVTAPVGLRLRSASSSMLRSTSSSSLGVSAEESSDVHSDAASISSAADSTADSFYSLNNESHLRQQHSRQASMYFDAASMGRESPPSQSVDGASEYNTDSSPGRRHKREISELTITGRTHLSEDERSPFTPSPRADERPTSAPPTPTLTSDSDSAVDLSYPDIDPPPENIRLRRLTSTSHLRAFSPMPHPANLFTPPAQAHPKKEYRTAIMQKTMGMLIGPPAHLVALMLRIAARIATGVFTPDSWRLRRGKKIPGAWQWSEDEADEWDDEDDYGIPLGNYRRRETDASDVD